MAYDPLTEDLDLVSHDIDRAEALGMMAVALSGIGAMFLAAAIAIWM
jgi:hypothetical protein